MNINKYVDKLHEFHDAFQVKEYETISMVPEQTIELRIKLLNEEKDETLTALQHARIPDLFTKVSRENLLDGLTDLLYVTIGTANVCGYKPSQITLMPSTSYDKELNTVTYLTHHLRCALPCIRRAIFYTNDIILELFYIAQVFGLNLDKAFDAVHENNMQKLWDTLDAPAMHTVTEIPIHSGDYVFSRYLVKDSNGKVIKPPNHKKVDLSSYV